ncbi:CDIF630_02480 family spore surface protein [Garciella nitratireducens]|uniref:DUF3787 domain-containing protein n=1 Tax=Garciella nitratireducens DSM 15102 TaxID=1121911 RepID=A0A1T4KFY5_9FIRM|nr:DUF3787 domain-containing protein [Garciella nitratireducens]SJZ41296.1 protein of unknown function [Garciella nitratireducens DSM 15102]
MTKNKKKQKYIKSSMEKESRESLGKMERKDPETNVHIPTEYEVINDKAWVDTNEK